MNEKERFIKDIEEAIKESRKAREEVKQAFQL